MVPVKVDAVLLKWRMLGDDGGAFPNPRNPKADVRYVQA
jgi:hypothetical protein